MKHYFLYGCVVTVPIFITAAITRYLKQQFKELDDPNEGDVYSYIITPKNEECWKHVMNIESCGEECSFNYVRRVVERIEEAKVEILICVNHLTVNDITNALLKMKGKGVSVRCITDCAMIKVMGTKFSVLKKNGIVIKTNKNGTMHHKFFLVDGKFLSFGSLNFTMQGFSKNFEHAVETNNRKVVERFKNEFEEIWMNENDY